MSQARRNWLQRKANAAIGVQGEDPGVVRQWLIQEGSEGAVADEIIATAIEKTPAIQQYFRDMDRERARDLRYVTPSSLALLALVFALIYFASR